MCSCFGTAVGGEVRAKGPCICLAQANGLGASTEGNRRANGPTVCEPSEKAKYSAANSRAVGPNLLL